MPESENGSERKSCYPTIYLLGLSATTCLMVPAAVDDTRKMARLVADELHRLVRWRRGSGMLPEG